MKEWHDTTMPDETADAVLVHLEEEARELLMEPSFEEAADVLLCLFAWTSRRGFALPALMYAAASKLEINKRRKWVKMPNGTYHHK